VLFPEMSQLVSVAVAALSCWLPPVDAPVIDPFREPACVWCPGNRGLEYGTAPGVAVRAVSTGTVTFSDQVAGTGYVVVRHADGRRATYGGIERTDRAPGQVVVAGSIVGVTTGTFHFGLRDGERYLDPAQHLGRPVTRARLVPVDGSPGRPAPATRVRCTGRPVEGPGG
jgi:murein DD-endopeptidase MepM/ murein hydrolase activator NlpD